MNNPFKTPVFDGQDRFQLDPSDREKISFFVDLVSDHSDDDTDDDSF